jgi:LPS-assembly protein
VPATADGAAQPQEDSRANMTVVPRGADGNPDATRVTHVNADSIGGRDQVDMTAYGAVHLTRKNLVLDSDQLYWDQVANEVTVEGNVHFEHVNDTIDGTRAKLNLDTWNGEFDKPVYSLQRQRRIKSDTWPLPGRPPAPTTELVKGSGHADVAYVEGENHYRLTHSTYTTCPAPDPSWYLRINTLKLDFDRDKGTATGSTMVFKDVPIAYMPWAEFPLSGGRQSGFLPPTIGGGTNTGVDITVPYYFNIAPNYDLTLAPRYMSDRGTQIGAEGRYLTQNANGIMRGEYLNDDQLTRDSRYAVVWKHVQNFGNGFSGGVDATQVSDKTYFADLSSKIGITSQSTLAQQANLAYNSGSWFSSNVLVQRYQVLSGDAPYNRMPQVSLNAAKSLYGFDANLPVEFTDFKHPSSDEGRRTAIYPQISYPIETSSFFLTPKMGVHYTSYNITRSTTDGDSKITTEIPTFSLDSGLIFERDTSIGGKAQVQTLEPRIYYVRTPYKDQSQIPVYDTAVADFNFAQIFSENRYVGKDRVADANQLTAGVQSKMISADSGEEWLRTALAQRYYFSDQRVTLPGETVRSGRVADVLGDVSGRLFKDVWSDNAVEYQPSDGRWQRATTQLRYQPDSSKVASIAYRYELGVYRDLDISAQWPLWGRLYGVGRYDLNLRDHRLSEAIAGLEFKGDCWVLRTVWQSLLTSSQTRNTSFYVQLEFNGLASLGNNPVNLLKRSVNGYGKINDPSMGDPKFGDSSEP